MSGLICIDRALLNHHIVGIENPRYMAAWLWLLARANWKPKMVFLNNAEIELQRGQLTSSIKFMSEKTGLSEKEMRTFLSILEKSKMIEKTGTPKGIPKGKGATVITICNYEHYQNFDNYRASPRASQWADQGRTKGRPRADDITPDKQLNQDKQITATSASAHEKNNPSSFDLLVQALPKIYEAMGITDETKNPNLISPAEPLRWIEQGCSLEMDIIPTIKTICARGKEITNWAYFSKAVFAAKARREAPAPVIQLSSIQGGQPSKAEQRQAQNRANIAAGVELARQRRNSPNE